MKDLLLVAAGSALGGATRFLVSGFFLGESFPFSLLTINLIGSFLAGVWMGSLPILSEQMGSAEQVLKIQLFIAVGILGGFTTFSAFSLETIKLLQHKQIAPAFYFVALSVFGSLLLTVAGFKIAVR